MSDYEPELLQPTRRLFLQSTAWLTSASVLASPVLADNAGDGSETDDQPGSTYETHAVGIRILPGAWRPHYPWEHIAWISPPWPSQDYLWLDFPEAIFTSQGLLYLSHVNPPIQTVYQNLPPVSWTQIQGGIGFERNLPNGVTFGGRVTRGKGPTVDLELHLHNGSGEPLAGITLQTCAFLRAIKEFADLTQDNKRVHVPGDGWIPLASATERPAGTGTYRVGWRTRGKPVADLPVALVVSNAAERLVAMTWFDDTLSMVGNPRHPCIHADPRFADLAPGERGSIRGKLIFFDGPLDKFDFARYA